MEALLKRVGADIVDQKGPTQVSSIFNFKSNFIKSNFFSSFKLHNLLEIIKQEQDIYNIVFHEVIRQVK